MGKIGMVKDGKYFIKVIDIKPCVKQVKKQTGTFIRHDITVEDKHGNTLVCEFLGKTEIPTEFALNVWQWIKCLYPEANGATVEPTEPPADNPTALAASRITEDPDKPSTLGINDCSVKNISGSSITFAMAYAKDIKAAEIARRPEGARVTDQDIDEVVKWAFTINSKICDLIKY